MLFSLIISEAAIMSFAFTNSTFYHQRQREKILIERQGLKTHLPPRLNTLLSRLSSHPDVDAIKASPKDSPKHLDV